MKQHFIISTLLSIILIALFTAITTIAQDDISYSALFFKIKPSMPLHPASLSQLHESIDQWLTICTVHTRFTTNDDDNTLSIGATTTPHQQTLTLCTKRGLERELTAYRSSLIEYKTQNQFNSQECINLNPEQNQDDFYCDKFICRYSTILCNQSSNSVYSVVLMVFMVIGVIFLN